MTDYRIAPSILSADFARLGEEVAEVIRAGADLIHFDVMDNHYVPNLTFGPMVCAALKPYATVPVDVHLMVEHPQYFVRDFSEAGADYFTFHIEATVHAHRLITEIRAAGMKPGISLVPSTPVHLLDEVLPFIDLVLVMTVNPGFGGQVMIPRCLEKVRQLCSLREHYHYHYLISVDGGINAETLPAACKAGADVIVSGSSFFSGDIKR